MNRVNEKFFSSTEDEKKKSISHIKRISQCPLQTSLLYFTHDSNVPHKKCKHGMGRRRNLNGKYGSKIKKVKKVVQNVHGIFKIKTYFSLSLSSSDQ